MDPSQEEIANIASKYGLTEDEAQVLYHIERAAALYRELPGRTSIMHTVRVGMALESMRALLMERVLHRDRPEGWQRSYLSEEEPDQQ